MQKCTLRSEKHTLMILLLAAFRIEVILVEDAGVKSHGWLQRMNGAGLRRLPVFLRLLNTKQIFIFVSNKKHKTKLF